MNEPLRLDWSLTRVDESDAEKIKVIFFLLRPNFLLEWTSRTGSCIFFAEKIALPIFSVRNLQSYLNRLEEVSRKILPKKIHHTLTNFSL